MTLLTTSFWQPTGADERETSLGDELAARARQMPDRLALAATPAGRPGELARWTWAEIASEAEAGARALLSVFQPGTRIGVWAPNYAEWVLLFHSAATAGMHLVPLNPMLQKVEAAEILRDSGCAALFVVSEHRGALIAATAAQLADELPALRQIVDLANWESFLTVHADTHVALPQTSPDDIALVQYTSGTTGRPKGALLTHRVLVHASIRSGRALGLEAADVYVNPFPLFHVGGTVGAIGTCLTSGAALAPLPAFDLDHFVDLLSEASATVTAGVPTVLDALLPRLQERPEIAERLRTVSSGAAPVPEALVEAFARLGIPVSVSYGQSECPTITRSRPSDDARTRATTVGRPVDGLAVRIVDPETATTVPVGTVGELWVQGSNVMAGYLDQEAATHAVLTAEGWLRTGDLASMSPTGHCSILGRLREVIIRGGENIYPREVEDVLREHPTVQDVAVLGSPDSAFGEQVLAVVVPAPGASLRWEELSAFARSQLASFKVPRRWRSVDTLPRNAAGKVQKNLIDVLDYEVEERFVVKH